ncbi:MAG: YitT family protein [Ignavibacteriales bacterium]
MKKKLLKIRKKLRNHPVYKRVKPIALIIVGALLAAVGLELFLIPNNIIDGGIIGVSIIFSYIFKLPLGLFIFFLNLPFLFIGYKQIGKTFAITTLLGVFALSLFTYSLKSYGSVTQDLLLSTVFGGVLLGVGVGTIIRNGGSLDGTEIISIIINRNISFSVGEIVMFFNIFILLSAGFVFGWEKAMYSLITYFIAYKSIDATIEGVEQMKAVTIISTKPKDIQEAIYSRLGRNITFLYGKSGYTGIYKEIIYCVVSRLELAKLKKIVLDFDPDAFIAIEHVSDVVGRRFRKKSIH